MKITTDMDSLDEIMKSTAIHGLIQLLKDGVTVEVIGEATISNVWYDEITGQISLRAEKIKNG